MYIYSDPKEKKSKSTIRHFSGILLFYPFVGTIGTRKTHSRSFETISL